MKAKVKYTNKGVFGIGKSQQFYVAQVKSEYDGVQLTFNFPTRADDQRGYSTISDASLHLTRKEAEEILAALTSLLNHPNNRGNSETWVTFRGMPLIADKTALSELIFDWNKEKDFPKVKVTNLSKFHISEVICSVTQLAREVYREETHRFEYESQKLESKIILNLAPSESVDVYFDDLPTASKIESIEVRKANGYRIRQVNIKYLKNS